MIRVFVYHTAWASALLLVFGKWAMREPLAAGQVTETRLPRFLFLYVSAILIWNRPIGEFVGYENYIKMNTQRRVYNWMQIMKQKITSVWDTTFSNFCLTILIFLLSLGNSSILYLLPLGVGMDFFVLIYSVYLWNKKTFSQMQKDKLLFIHAKELESSLKDEYLTEISRFRMYKEGNRFGTKSISIYISTDLFNASTSYSFFSEESIVLLHGKFDVNETIDRFTLLHEMVHCIGHSLFGIKQIATQWHSNILFFTIIITSIFMCFWWMILLGTFLWFIMMFLETSIARKSREEMEADAVALMLFEHLYGKEQKSMLARVITNRYYDGILQKNLTERLYLKNALWSVSRFMSESDREHFIERMDKRISIGEDRAKKLKSLKLQVQKSQRIESFNNGILTWQPTLYYLVFPLLIILSWFTTSKVAVLMNISWWSVFFFLIPMSLIVVFQKRVKKTIILIKNLVRETLNNKYD